VPILSGLPADPARCLPFLLVCACNLCFYRGMDNQNEPDALTGLNKQAHKRGVIDTRSLNKRPFKSSPAGQDPKKPFECCICGAGVVDGTWPHNPDPFEGEACCTDCNDTQVIPARLLIHSTGLRPPASGIVVGGREHTLIKLLSHALYTGAADPVLDGGDE
tara:strand:- start:627 stop:1112 length:486 start_codon:yes stop_codon:yes gene_type:complete